MHITKDVCESLLGTLLNIPERTKDGLKARADLKSMGIRQELHGNDDDDEAKQDTETRRKGKKAKKTGSDYPPACFTLNQQEIEQFFTCLVGVKLPTLRGEDKQIPRPSEAEVQRDEVSRLSRADDADTSSCNPWDHGRARP